MNNEATRLLQAVQEAQTNGTPAAIATVVRVRGSAYRREGTKMLITADGEQVCTISGGCLEQEVGEIAKRVITTGKPEIKGFDLDEDEVWGLGLGCGGAVDVYIEPLELEGPLLAWFDAVRNYLPAVLATRLATAHRPAKRHFISLDGRRLGNLGDPILEAHVGAIALEELSQLHPRSHMQDFKLDSGEVVEFFLDINVPPPELLIFGAGHDAIPLAAFARQLGFRVTVVDARQAFLTPEHFPEATLIRSHPSTFAERVEIDSRCYAVVMNHHLERDRSSLAFLLESPARYIGVLGPSSRYRQMLETLEVDAPPPDVRNPVGIDIGADTPEEIAVSIMAEILAVRGGYEGGFLKDREGPIHFANSG
jgi:xanthine/CO dehydrogenase XdhC/CoxF family maturation factor